MKTKNNINQRFIEMTVAWYYLGNSKSRAPLLFQNVKADTSIVVDVRVIDFGFKGNLLNTQYNCHDYHMGISS